MVPSLETRMARLSACRLDLLDNGIDLNVQDCRALCRSVRVHLAYFQLVLGYKAGLREVVGMIHPRLIGKSASDGGGIHCVSHNPSRRE